MFLLLNLCNLLRRHFPNWVSSQPRWFLSKFLIFWAGILSLELILKVFLMKKTPVYEGKSLNIKKVHFNIPFHVIIILFVQENAGVENCLTCHSTSTDCPAHASATVTRCLVAFPKITALARHGPITCTTLPSWTCSLEQ